MNPITLGIIREGKTPPDLRVPLPPAHCAEAMARFPGLKIVVQPSPLRRFTDDEYRSAGIELREDLSDCDILMGVKEVPVDMLIPSRTYIFFSHTIKRQPHNARLLKAILEKRIRLIDYETLRGTDGKRLIGFGRYAGIVGAYEGFRALGLKRSIFSLRSPSECFDRREMEEEMKRIILPHHFRMVVTGFGRVGHGAREIIDLLPIREVSARQFITESFDEPVYVHLDTHEYYERKVDGGFDKRDFYNNPDHYFSALPSYVRRSDMYMACHLWAAGNPVLLRREDLSAADWKCQVIADISCDTNGPIASTIRASTIAQPVYGYHRLNHAECDISDADAIAVMAIDNLPCELPRDASEAFGSELISAVFPLLFGEDPHDIIWKATETTLDGELTPHFEYLHDYATQA
ncbi:MAG: NAD(P)-dependent oxidoreductase [Flavobacteriales bacterium]|jgi:saccharopine dehydrogenase (NAD+, L-lysine-forming)